MLGNFVHFKAHVSFVNIFPVCVFFPLSYKNQKILILMKSSLQIFLYILSSSYM
jgi:hypothetical protein